MKIKKYIQVAIVMVAGSIMFTFTACSPQETTVQEQVAIEQVDTVVEEDNDVAEVDLIENADDITTGKESVTEETITLSYKQSGNGELELENQEETTIEEYKMEKPLESLVGTEIDVEITEEMVAETREDGSIVISADDLEIQDGYTLQYSYDKDTKEGKAIYMYQYLTWDAMEEDDIPSSGINVVLEKTENKYKIKGFEDIFGNNIDEIMLYRGEVVGWACGTADATEADFEFEDKARFSTDMELYPVLNVENEVVDEGVFKEIQHGFVVGLYGHKVPKQKLSGDNVTKGIYHVVKDKDGKTVLVTDEGGVIDPTTGENPEKIKEDTKTPEKKQETTTPGSTGGNTTPSTPKGTGETSTPAWTPDPGWTGFSEVPTTPGNGAGSNLIVE